MENEVLNDFLDAYLKPAFGNLSKIQTEMFILDLLEENKKITKDADQYTLSMELKISQAKAKNLLYNRALRKYSKEKLEKMTIELLQNPKQKTQGNNGWFLLEIENPLLLEYVKDKIRKLGYISDGSFSSSIIKLQAETFAALIENCIAEEERARIFKKLNLSKENSFKEILTEALESFAGQYIGEKNVALATKVLNIMKAKLAE